MSPVSLALQVDSLPTEPFGSYGNSMFTFFFEEPTYSFPQWLYHFNSSNSKGSYYWSKGSLTFSCFFFFFLIPNLVGVKQ